MGAPEQKIADQAIAVQIGGNALLDHASMVITLSGTILSVLTDWSAACRFGAARQRSEVRATRAGTPPE